jgi:hypothetical protein
MSWSEALLWGAVIVARSPRSARRSLLFDPIFHFHLGATALFRRPNRRRTTGGGQHAQEIQTEDIEQSFEADKAPSAVCWKR